MSFLGCMAERKQNLHNLKPGVNRSVHLFAAPLLWTGVGLMLMTRGWSWVGQENRVWFLLAAIAIGTAKSLLILDKTARRVVERIVRMRDGTCLGAIYSWQTWILVALMMASGILLRIFLSPGAVVGTVYLAIGWALVMSSRLGWLEWSRWIHHKE